MSLPRTSLLLTSAVFLLILAAGSWGVVPTLASEPSDYFEPPFVPKCSDPMYIRVNGTCVCRWGEFEALRPFGFRNICSFVGLNKLLGPGLFLFVVTNILTTLVVLAGVASIVIGGYFYMTAGGSADRG